MDRLYTKLLNEECSLKKNTFWYSLGTFCSSATSVLLLLYVTRILGTNEAGVFSIAYSVAQLILSIGWFGTRQFQISDIEETYSFSDYFNMKIITSVFALIFGVINAIYLKGNLYKTIIILLYCLFVISDIFADLFSARFQQVEKLHIAGKSYCIRIVGYNFIFLMGMLLTHSLFISIILAMIYSFIFLYLFDYQMIKQISTISLKPDLKKIFHLFKDCFPLFISSFLTIFILNIPKNAIDQLLSSEIQAFYNIIAMPSSVVNLFCMFIFVPQFTSIAVAWNERSTRFYTIIFKVLFFLVLISGLILVGGFILGIPILSFVYGVDLSSYKLSFMVLLLAGCFSSLNSILSYVITVFRKQKYILYIYFIALLISQGLIYYLVSCYGIFGASLDYLIGMFSISILFIFVIIFYSKKYKSK